MPKVISKRQVTLSIDLCALAGIEPSDEVSILVDRQGIISVVKKTACSSKEILRDVRRINNISDKNSLKSVMQPSR